MEGQLEPQEGQGQQGPRVCLGNQAPPGPREDQGLADQPVTLVLVELLEQLELQDHPDQRDLMEQEEYLEQQDQQALRETLDIQVGLVLREALDVQEQEGRWEQLA